MGILAGRDAITEHPHNYVNPPSNAWESTTADLIGLCLSFIVLVARYYTKVYITKSTGWEDHFSLLAFLSYVVRITTGQVGTNHYGWGRHLYDVPPQWYDGYVLTRGLAAYFYIIGIAFAKVSLLLFLYRIFRVDFRYRVASFVVGFVVVIWSTVSLLLIIFSCHPVIASWKIEVYLRPGTWCAPKSYDVINIQGFCNIITDFALLALPVPMVLRLQMTTRKKLSVAAVFATGISICIIAIVRQYIVYHTKKDGDNWAATRDSVWISIEFALSIIVACLPPLAPFFKHYKILSSFAPSSIRSKFSRRSPRQQKLSSGPTDVELGVPEDSNGSFENRPRRIWQGPRQWKNTEKQSSGEFDGVSQGSQTTLQPVWPTRREIEHGD